MKKITHQKRILEELREVPIVAHACKKIGLSRNTFYTWCRDDAVFAAKVRQAMIEGDKNINDIAENQLVKQITEGNLKATMYRLSRCHPRYQIKTFDQQMESYMKKKKARKDQKVIEEAESKVRKSKLDAIGKKTYLPKKATLESMLGSGKISFKTYESGVIANDEKTALEKVGVYNTEPFRLEEIDFDTEPETEEIMTEYYEMKKLGNHDEDDPEMFDTI
jgi:hypothetical protein